MEERRDPDNGCPTNHEFPKHLPDTSIWCPDCGATLKAETYTEDLPEVWLEED